MKAAAAFKGALLAPAVALVLGGCGFNVGVGQPFVQLRGTEWRVAAVNGRATPATGDYRMRFGATGEFGARFGCNSMGGRYRSVVGTLSVSDLAQTLMGCPEPAGSFEAQGSAVLQRQMKVSATNGRAVVLQNAAGSITLDPLR